MVSDLIEIHDQLRKVRIDVVVMETMTTDLQRNIVPLDAVNLLEETLFTLILSIWRKVGSCSSALSWSPVHDALEKRMDI